MRWSFSAARSFRQCQRGWFFKTCFANARAKDPDRREAHLLSKLQSVSGWRGKLVDRIISEQLVEALRRGQKITKSDMVAVARATFDRELDFALHHRIREPGMKLSENDSLAAFRAIEYGENVSETETARAWQDVQTSLDNLFRMEGTRSALKRATYVIAQRSLQFELAGVTVMAVPDIVAFHKEAPPLIVDWKVHTSGARDYRLQLALYAMALSRCRPHRDFPPTLAKFQPTEFRLTEVQLLVGVEHEYLLDATDLEELEDYIAASATEMLAATAGVKNGDLDPEDFPATEWAELCQRCAFKKVCWENADGRA
ncbi:MAG: PD-(D/E)XK nuclease family protein [Bryobacteraceae bacterium]